MIIDFSFANFRSFNGQQKISFVASNYDKGLPQNLIDPRLPGELSGLKILKGVALFGANAAGKTNVLHALHYVAHMVENSVTDLDEGDTTGVEAFGLSELTLDEPSEFVLRFVVEGVRYHFSLVLDEKRVLFESLSAFPKGREQVWYERRWDDETGGYRWRPDRPTGYRRDPSLVKFTRENALFLSTAVKLNDTQLKPLYLWFKTNLRFLRLDAAFPPLSPGFTARMLTEGANSRAAVVRLLRNADFGLLSARATEQVVRREDLPGDIPDEIAKAIMKERHFHISLGHRGATGREYSIDWEEESSGTQKFFALSGLWLAILENGYFAAFDEIESSMHPAMVSELLKLVFSEEHNPHAAQMLFTTHNPILLDPALMRRDQVWFAEKDEEGGTHIYPLTDYKPRKGESVVRGYLAGRYGAVPFIPEGLLGGDEE